MNCNCFKQIITLKIINDVELFKSLNVSFKKNIKSLLVGTKLASKVLHDSQKVKIDTYTGQVSIL